VPGYGAKFSAELTRSLFILADQVEVATVVVALADWCDGAVFARRGSAGTPVLHGVLKCLQPLEPVSAPLT